jgi:hypothetical protein
VVVLALDDRRARSLTNPRDLRINEVWAASDGSAILDVALTADYSQEFEARLPDPAAPPGLFTWTQMTQRSPIVLTFDVLQHADAAERFAARLTGWQDVSDVPFAST